MSDADASGFGRLFARIAAREAELDLGRRRPARNVCALFLAPSWRGTLRSSREGAAFWATERELTGTASAFPAFNRWAFERLAKEKRE